MPSLSRVLREKKMKAGFYCAKHHKRSGSSWYLVILVESLQKDVLPL